MMNTEPMSFVGDDQDAPAGRLDAWFPRRRFIVVGFSLAVGVLTGCGSGRRPSDLADDPMMGDMGGMGERPSWMMSGGGGTDVMRDMRVIHTLLARHTEITREVNDLPGGIRSITTSDSPELAELIRTHVGQMKARIETGWPIREMDPLFREIFRHSEAIEMSVESAPGGARVTETSPEPQVELLIRQHARRAVSEFVASGMSRAMRPTPLPEGYRG